MTFNVRQPDGDDGENNWDLRKDLLVDTLLEKAPDVIGTQELFGVQAEFIQSRAPQYAWFGTGRFGDGRDKHVGIFYRCDRLKLLKTADFWLSETPEKPGSASWNILNPRQVTWGRFATPDGATFQLFNTHFPYRREEQEARLRTAELLLDRISALPPALPVILTADFNSGPDSEVYSRLTSSLCDAWMTAGSRIGPEGTLNGFGRVTTSRRIDWILYRAPWFVAEIETLVRRRGTLYPSDHDPVVARFEWAR